MIMSRPDTSAARLAPALLVLTLTFVTAPMLARPASAALQPCGNVLATRVGSDLVDFVLDSGAIVRVQAVDADIVRVRVAPSGQLSTFVSHAIVAGGTTPPGAVIYDFADATYIIAPQFMFAAIKRPFRTFVWRADGSIVSADLDPAFAWDHSTGLVLTRKWAQPEEHYFGLGERGGPLDRRGRRFAMKNVDNGAYGEFTDPLYVSIPFYWGMERGRAHGVFLDNPAGPFFEFDPDNTGQVSLGAMKGDLDYYVMAGPTPAAVANAYARLTGFPQLPPKWTLGYQQSRYGYTSQEQVLNVAAGLRFVQVPADVIYFDIDYMDAMQMFTWNTQAFPEPMQMNAALGQLGFHRVNIMEPLIPASDRLWSYFAASGFLLTGPDGQALINQIWAGYVSWFDFTDPRARRWYMDYLKAFLTTGIDAVWNDLNEPAQNYMSEAIYDNDGDPRTDLEARNVFALIEARTSHDAQLELRPDTRPWLLSRAGYAGLQRYGANWGGDQDSTFDAMRVSVQMQQSMALSGQNQYGHDVGGFLGSPSAELFIRWLEVSSYTPLFRNHAINSSLPREPWAFGAANLDIIRDVINERYRLMPYLYSVMATASRTGTPALAPALFHFPFDLSTSQQDDEFMLGPSLLVAPVLQEGATSRTVYLPAGSDWLDASTDMRHAGGLNVTVDAPLNTIPVFVRAGAVIPKAPVMPYVDASPLRNVFLHLYPGPSTTFTLYEDDGVSLQHASGAFLRTDITREDRTDGFFCAIRRAGGTWTAPAGRHWWLEFHATSQMPTSIDVNGEAVPQVASEAALWGVDRGWALAGQRLVVRVPASAGDMETTVHFP
jgi:alpha-glucosidase